MLNTKMLSDPNYIKNAIITTFDRDCSTSKEISDQLSVRNTNYNAFEFTHDIGYDDYTPKERSSYLQKN